MSLIKVGIIVEIFLFVGVFLWVRKLTSEKGRQPSLSKKTALFKYLNPSYRFFIFFNIIGKRSLNKIFGFQFNILEADLLEKINP